MSDGFLLSHVGPEDWRWECATPDCVRGNRLSGRFVSRNAAAYAAHWHIRNAYSPEPEFRRGGLDKLCRVFFTRDVGWRFQCLDRRCWYHDNPCLPYGTVTEANIAARQHIISAHHRRGFAV